MADDASPPQPRPQTLAQWLVAYPAVLLALGGGLGSAAPVVWRELVAWRKGVASSELGFLRAQQDLWTRNLGCAGEASSWEHDLPGGVMLMLSVCPSGDLLVRWFYPTGNGEPPQPQYRWLKAPPPTR